MARQCSPHHWPLPHSSQAIETLVGIRPGLHPNPRSFSCLPYGGSYVNNTPPNPGRRVFDLGTPEIRV
ncbi:hypothetical protein CPB84DRAFT_1788501 [Gymnopilus junonius]|uniref:Uncharacterized protein n=1 Tax=Gymnopilus junonius TaxID=109634 RepID=A0A9P5TJJ1_GYMJU|nr:hypothetical protein CPB84DRAFT_1788501 [Gymnopilus junonius]